MIYICLYIIAFLGGASTRRLLGPLPPGVQLQGVELRRLMAAHLVGADEVLQPAGAAGTHHPRGAASARLAHSTPFSVGA